MATAMKINPAEVEAFLEDRRCRHVLNLMCEELEEDVAHAMAAGLPADTAFRLALEAVYQAHPAAGRAVLVFITESALGFDLPD